MSEAVAPLKTIETTVVTMGMRGLSILRIFPPLNDYEETKIEEAFPDSVSILSKSKYRWPLGVTKLYSPTGDPDEIPSQAEMTERRKDVVSILENLGRKVVKSHVQVSAVISGHPGE